jgi:hypothetical protein
MILRRLTGPAMLLAAGLGLALAGCGGDDVLGANEGRVRFVLSGDPTAAAGDQTASVLPGLQTGEEPSGQASTLHSEGFDGDRTGWFQSANVTFSSILARNQDGVLTDPSMDLPVTVDIIKMENGKEITLPDGELPVGTYDQIVVVMTEVFGVTNDGTGITLTPPGGGWTSIVPICPFIVEEGATTVVGLTLRFRNLFAWREMRYHFQPQFSCDSSDSGSGS